MPEPTQYKLALARTKELHPDYDQRCHRGSVVAVMSDAGYTPERIAHVLTALAGYNDEANFSPADAAMFVGDVKTRETWLAAQLIELKERAANAK